MSKTPLAFIAAILLSACSSGPGENQVVSNRKGDMVEGDVGANWSNEELQTNAYGVICDGPNETVKDLQITQDANGNRSYTARCVS